MLLGGCEGPWQRTMARRPASLEPHLVPSGLWLGSVPQPRDCPRPRGHGGRSPLCAPAAVTAHGPGRTTPGRGLCGRLLAPRAPGPGCVPSLCWGCSSFWNLSPPIIPFSWGMSSSDPSFSLAVAFWAPCPLWPSCGTWCFITWCHPAPLRPSRCAQAPQAELTGFVLTRAGTAAARTGRRGSPSL